MSNFTEQKTKKARTTYIRDMLATNAAWAVRGLIRIYENQTEDEQRVQETVEYNGIGFTGADAHILTSFAEQVNAGRTLSEKQMNIVFKRMPKYARQLETVSERKS